jgi:hypothetical protein
MLYTPRVRADRSAELRALPAQAVSPARPILLSLEAVEGPAPALECVDYVHSRDSIAAGKFGVGRRVVKHAVEELIEHAAGLLVHEARDTLHAATTGQATDCPLGDASDVVAFDIPVALRAALAKTFSSLAAPGHVHK